MIKKNNSFISDENYALILGEQEEIRVNINVNNTADSAYETQLFIVHQKSVEYIAAIKTVRSRLKINKIEKF